MTDLDRARNVAARYLGYAARSAADIRRRLERGHFDDGTIEAVIAEFRSRGWLDDAKFARDWIEDRSERKQYGRARLAGELTRRGIDRDTVDAAVEGIDSGDEVRRALAAAMPRYCRAGLSAGDQAGIEREYRRLAGFLQRRGFDWDIIKEVIRELAENNT